VVYYQALRQDERVSGLVAASPDLHGHWPAPLVAEAERLVEAGQGTELLPAQMGAHWYRLSAQNVASRARVLSQIYASDTGVPHLAEVRSPLLALFGSYDVGGPSELEVIRANAVKSGRVETHVIEDADHVYTDCEAQVAGLIADWVDTLA
jgi:pimeloyl-ACP methyl ester carboxylesterase